MTHPTLNAGLPRFPLRGTADVDDLTTCLDEGARALAGALAPGWTPQVLLVLGSGLGDLADAIEDPAIVPYGAVPHLQSSTAPGHAGRFLAGRIEGTDVLCMQGRLHPYEGYSPIEATYPIRLAARLGTRSLIATNATGAINTAYRPGQIVAIADHINLTGQNPLAGANLPDEGPRFPDMSHAYTPRLRTLAREAAHELGYALEEGVYIGLTGPSFETPAEIRAFRTLGADLVGMSTVWEVIVAAHCGLEVLGLSMATNMAAGVLDEPISMEAIGQAEQKGAATMRELVHGVLRRM